MLMIGKQLTPAQRVMKAISDILGNKKYDAIGSIVMIGKHEVVEHGYKTITTAATDGKDTWYSDEFIDSLSDANLRFLVLHECFHVLLRHLTTYKYLHEQNHKLANSACDYVINIKLFDYDDGEQFIVMPERGLLDPKYRNMDAAQVFKLLKDDPQYDQQSGQGGGGEPLDHHDWDGANEMSEAEQAEINQLVDQALRQGALLAGKTGSGGERLIEDLIASKIDYKEAMREWVNDTCTGSDYSTWTKPNRRYIGSNIFMPSGVSMRVGELIVANDMSGSIGAREIAVILGELANIAESVQPEGIRILYWDTAVCADEYYEHGTYDTMIGSTKPVGGGGTDVTCVSNYIADKGYEPQGVVIITDGYLGGDWGTWSVPTLWVIIDNPSTTAPVGYTIHVSLGDLS
jgi:predicted metal-dependent peptidase